MKLRLTAKSVRLRLTQPEVKTLGETGSLEECIPLAPEALRIRLQSAHTPGPAASFNGRELTVELPAGDVAAWSASEQVGIEGDCRGVRILVEKDFECLHPADPEENTNTYPNPASR